MSRDVRTSSLDSPDEVARRIYQRVSESPRKYHTMLEGAVDEVLEKLEAAEAEHLDSP